MKLFFSHYRHAHYEVELYAPLRSSALSSAHELILPHEHGSIVSTKEAVRSADILFAEVTTSATGIGIEIGWADAAGVPVVCVFKKDAKPSDSLQFITKDFIEYADSADLIAKIEAYLAARK